MDDAPCRTKWPVLSDTGSESAGMRLRQRGWICVEAELMPTTPPSVCLLGGG
jgi:hypothetical protein